MESHEGGFDNLRVSLDDDCIDYRNRSASFFFFFEKKYDLLFSFSITNN